MTTPSGLPALCRQVRVALEQLADALTQPDLHRVLAIEPVLAQLTGQLQRCDAVSLQPSDPQDLTGEALAARAALLRCRRLGMSLDAIVHATLAVQGRASGYDRLGAEAVQPPAGAFGTRG